MDHERGGGAFEPTIPGAVWRYRWLVLALGLVGGALGVAFALAQPEEWVATSSIVVEDPRASAVFELGAAQRPERYVENQVEILRSQVVAERAGELLGEGDEPYVLDADAIDEGSSIRSRNDRDLITISFTDEDPDLAQATADALAVAYQDVRRSEAARNSAAALRQLDESITAGEQELTELQQRISAARSANGSREELDRQFTAAVDQLAALQGRVLAGEAAAAVADQLAELRDQFATLQLVLGIEALQPELSALVEEQTEAIRRLSVLIARRDQIAVDSEIAGAGVVLFSPAPTPVQTGTSLARAVPIGGLLGGLVGAGAAYAMVLRRRRFTARGEPELVLGAPLMAEVPDFGDERVKGLLPVLDAPASVSAEAFRFAAAALDAAPAEGDARGLSPVRSIVVVSADPGDGKSVVAANMALAAARAGKRVLVVDADFGNQQLAATLAPGLSDHQGLTDVVLADTELSAGIAVLSYEDGTVLHLLGRGRNATSAPEFFSSPVVRRYFEAFRGDYELVVIDAPPMLHVAYAGSLVRFGDRAVVVVRHGSSVTALEDLRDRLRLLGARVAGYVYNRSPLRREMTLTGGSTVDVLGGAGIEPVRAKGVPPDPWNSLRRRG